jgi:hypothetical protein
MSKGFAVVSGSNNVVFKALESGLTVFGSPETDTDMRITGSVNITGSLHLNGVDVDQKLKDLFDDLDPSDLDSIKELAVAQKITSSVIYEDVSAVWASAQAPVEDSIVQSGGLILRGPRPGWRFAKSVYPDNANAKIAWYFYNGDPTTGGEDRTLGSLQDMYAVVTMDSTNSNSKPYFAVYTVPQGDGQDASWYRSRSVYVDLGSQTFVSGTKYLFYFGDEAPLVHPELPRIKLGWADPATHGAGGSAGPEGASERILYIGLVSDSSTSTADFVVESVGLRFGDGSTDDSIREIKLDIRNRSMGTLTVTGNGTIGGSLTVGTDHNDLLNVQSRLRVPKILRTDTAALAYMSANAADLEGEIFYLKGAGDDSNTDFPEGNKFYYNEDGRWFETNSFWG